MKKNNGLRDTSKIKPNRWRYLRFWAPFLQFTNKYDKIDAIFEKVEQDRHISSYDVAGELAIDHKTVLAHLKKAGYTKKLDIWVPHELTERNLMNRVLICDSLLRRNETEPFLKKLITGDEKWITYDKNVRKRSWSKAGEASQTVARPGLTRNKVMLYVWWD
ncbi:hypothetical protein K1T71_000504 [Dendrolimus kikuchii]|uniref:Uncharacterized protein n=1 Tax=Dendrolimus kikuchii TaxID=765133 RepID=A0ACC1DKR8_9NEOP|nr:hypothetical protein K1T71_000504 [Dendrolimus kikuchii]